MERAKWDSQPRAIVEVGGNRTLGRPKIALDAFTTICADKLRMVRGLPIHQVYFQKIAD